jgi:hypothetical protein
MVTEQTSRDRGSALCRSSGAPGIDTKKQIGVDHVSDTARDNNPCMGTVGWPVGGICQTGGLEAGRFSLAAAAVVVERSGVEVDASGWAGGLVREKGIGRSELGIPGHESMGTIGGGVLPDLLFCDWTSPLESPISL